MKKHYLLCIIPALLLSGCNTYHLSTQSLLEQFAHVKGETKVTMLIVPPFVCYPGIVRGNDLREITVVDKKEKEHTFPVTRSMGIKITQKSGKHTTFYINTLLLKDSTITGDKTHFFKSQIKPIYFANISKIELQR